MKATSLFLTWRLQESSTIYAPETDQLENTLKKFWETKVIAIKGEVQDANVDATDDPFLRKLVYNGKRHEVGLPWNENVTEMSDHYNLQSIQKPAAKIARQARIANRIQSDYSGSVESWYH